MAHDVFISYSSKDKPIADAVVAGLENQGIRCWIAPRDISPGSSWGQTIIEAIEGSKFMVIILSGNSNSSNQVIREVERAVAKDVIIIPFRIENIDPTGAMEYFLFSDHWLDAITPPLEKHIQKLATTIQVFQEGGAKPKARQQTPRPAISKPGLFRRWWPVLLTLVILFLVTVVALGIIFIPKLLAKDSPVTPTMPAVASADTGSPATPTEIAIPTFNVIGEYRISGSANGLFVTDNNFLYLASGIGDLTELSVADPTNPKPIAVYLADDAQDVVVQDGFVYNISGDHSRRLIISQLGGDGTSVSIPGDGQSLSGTQSIYNITIVNGLAHLTGHNYWGILDVSDPMNPRELWSWEPPSHSGNPCNADVVGDIAYIGCGWAGFFIFDIADPSNPEQLGRFETPNWVIAVAVEQQVAYLTLGESGLYALDVSDPERPLLLGSLNLTGFASSLSVSGDLAYLVYLVYEESTLVESGVIAVNISDPETMTIVATYDKLVSGTDIHAQGDAVFVTDEPRGLIVLSLGTAE
ncbi:TIR domain-containing protein [Chloroflexota bacterium]